MTHTLTHLHSQTEQPTMVDISNKDASARFAKAQSRISLPAAAMTYLREQGFASSKGSVIHTAVLAGIMAAKQTSSLIPLCHTLTLTSCTVDIHDEENDFVVECSVQTLAQTGVEMEALMGASVAALTLYDMCKSLVKETPYSMVIHSLQLLTKTK